MFLSKNILGCQVLFKPVLFLVCQSSTLLGNVSHVWSHERTHARVHELASVLTLWTENTHLSYCLWARQGLGRCTVTLMCLPLHVFAECSHSWRCIFPTTFSVCEHFTPPFRKRRSSCADVSGPVLLGAMKKTRVHCQERKKKKSCTLYPNTLEKLVFTK